MLDRDEYGDQLEKACARPRATALRVGSLPPLSQSCSDLIRLHECPLGILGTSTIRRIIAGRRLRHQAAGDIEMNIEQARGGAIFKIPPVPDWT